MKTTLHFVFLFTTICSACAGEITIQSYSVKKTFPSTDYLLNQPSLKQKGKAAIIPYIFCGFLTEKDFKDYAVIPEHIQNKNTSTATLPNGAICHVALLSHDVAKGAKQIRVEIDIVGPKNLTTKCEITTYPEERLLFRYEALNNSKKKELILLQIKKMANKSLEQISRGSGDVTSEHQPMILERTTHL